MKKTSQATSAFAFYCLITAIYLAVGGLTQSRYGLLGVGINEIVLLAIPSFVYGKFLLQGKMTTIFPLRYPEFRDVLLSLLLTALTVAVTQLYLHFQAEFWTMPEATEKFYTNLMQKGSLRDTLLQFSFLALIPAICEEFFFRGLLQSALLPHFKPIKTILLISIFFAVAHANIYFFAFYFLLGLLLSYLRYLKNNLVLCIAAHFFVNFVSLFGYR